MDITTIETFVASIGFPIVAFLLMYKSNIDMRKEHKEEVSTLSHVIESNTRAIERLVEKMEGD